MNHTSFFSQSAQYLRELTEEQYAAVLALFLDEQPHLTGFLINLSDDFEDDEHDALMRTVLVLNESFRRAAVSVGLISHHMLQVAIDDVTSQIEGLSEADKLELNELAKSSRSPFVFQELQAFLHQELRRGLPQDEVQQHNLLVLVDVLIGAFEEAIETESKTNDE